MSDRILDRRVGSDTVETVSRRFEGIYSEDEWTLGSGPGSLRKANIPFIRFLEGLLAANHVRSMVDFGCGDWQFMSGVNLEGIRYFGFDVVDHVLENNMRQFGSAAVVFARTPSNLDDLPVADVLLVKDVLIHVPNSYVSELMVSALRKFRFIIAVNNESTDATLYNRDIEFGAFRPIDLSRPPFSMPVVTVFRYGKLRIADPRMPWLLAILRRKFVWPGRKHVQLIVGEPQENVLPSTPAESADSGRPGLGR